MTAPAAPRPPVGLDAVGVAVWNAVWAEPQVRQADSISVLRLATLESEAAVLRATVETGGAVLKRPIQNARGEIIGTEHVSHPALNAIRMIGREAAALCDALGLTPLGRNRLGLNALEDAQPPDFLDRIRAEQHADWRRGDEADSPTPPAARL